MFPPFNFRFGQAEEDPHKRLFNHIFDPVQEESNPYQFSRTEDPGARQVPEPQTQSGFMDVYKELMNRQNGPAMSAYRKFVEQPAPTRADFKPSKTSRLGAILSGAAASFTNPSSNAGQEIVQNMIDKPYLEGMKRYGDEGGRLREAANLEETDTKNRVSAVKSVLDAKNQEEDNKRQDLLASSLIKSRNLTAQKTQQEIEANGAKFELDKTTGIGYLVKNDGSRKPVGKFDQSTGEKMIEDVSKMQEQDRLVGTRQVRLAGINFGNNRALQEDRQAHDVTMETARQANRIATEQERQKGREAITKSKLDAAQKRIDSRINVAKDPSINQKIKAGLFKAQSLVDADPSLEDYWDIDNAKDPLKSPPSDHNSPEYAAWNKLYNALYGDINSGVKVTKSGNKIER